MSDKKLVAISPDGMTLEYEPKEHDNIESVKAEILEWKLRYKGQGYYSSGTHGRIPYDEIEFHCDFQEI